MLKKLRLWVESLRFAAQALRANLLRTVLSLLGVTVGIFAIVAVFTLVDALERGLRDSFSFLGDKIIYVQKFPWNFGPNYPWWKYVQRPDVTPRDYRFLEAKLDYQNGLAMFAAVGNKTIRYESSTLEGVSVQGVSYEFDRVSDVRLARGRYFTRTEIARGRNVAIVGAEIADKLFPQVDPLGETIKIGGLRYVIIGLLEKQGESLVSAGLNNDLNCLVPYALFAKLYGVPPAGPQPLIAIKGFENDDGLMLLESEVRGVMRAARSLKPREEDDFALNRPELIAQQVTRIFSVVSVAGWVIGSFSILVGGFGIANIMFVSVKERTNQIGIQKSLGARNAFVLNQFLAEAVFLSLIGGVSGLLLVFLLTFVPVPSLDLRLTASNVMLGLVVSAVVGMVSGIAPAYVAARLEPVIAIRAQ